ncbi:MAG: hypothetical protein TV42_04770 [Wolbachia endosymbiont of Dactylopius coccus]|nr:MAG: hypothetical protein TV42_04770 [Wolbachia endosymbiont of Dactylopius coccus]
MESRAWFIWLISNLVVIFSNMQIIYAFISVNLEKELGLTIAQVALANSYQFPLHGKQIDNNRRQAIMK